MIPGWTHLLTVSEYSQTIFSGSATSTLVLGAQPPSGGCYLKITSDTAITLSISDDTNYEDVVFTGSRDKQTVKEYVPTLTISCSGYTGDVTLLIESVDISGNYIYLGSSVTNYPCIIEKQTTTTADLELLTKIGASSKNLYIINVKVDTPLELNDEFLIIGNSDTYKVISEPYKSKFTGTNTNATLKFKAVRVS